MLPSPILLAAQHHTAGEGTEEWQQHIPNATAISKMSGSLPATIIVLWDTRNQQGQKLSKEKKTDECVLKIHSLC